MDTFLMNSCLTPPNSARLSGDVIGSVILRPESSNPRFGNLERINERNVKLSDHFKDLPCFIRPLKKFDDKRKRLRDVGDHTSTIDIMIGEKNRQRELRRKRQVRYRKKKDMLGDSLEQETKKLQREILVLQQRHHTFLSAVPEKETGWNVATQYFHHFRYGYQPSMTVTTGLAPLHVQLEFLRATMALDIVHDTGHGAEALLLHWKRFSLWFKHIECQLISLEHESEDLLLAATTTSFTIAETTLINVFPHLCGNEREPRSPLANKLLGQRIVMKGSLRLDWDSAFGRVTRILSESDMMAPMLSVLGNVDDVSVAFGKALVGPDFRLKQCS